MRYENPGRYKNSAHDTDAESSAHAGSTTSDATPCSESRPQQTVDAETGIQIGQRPRRTQTYGLPEENTTDANRGVAA